MLECRGRCATAFALNGTGLHSHSRLPRARRPRPRTCFRKGCGRKYQPRCWNQRYCQDPECLRQVRRWQDARRQAKRRRDDRVKAQHAQAEKERRRHAKTMPKAVENPEVAPHVVTQQKFFSLPLCDRPGCHEPPVISLRNPARYCCAACRQAVRNVQDRERKWRSRGTLDGRKKRDIEYRGRTPESDLCLSRPPPPMCRPGHRRNDHASPMRRSSIIGVASGRIWFSLGILFFTLRSPSMITKPILVPDRLRRPPATGWSWTDGRFVLEHMDHLSREAVLLYFFLSAVADVNGLSFYGDGTVATRLRMTLPTLIQARDELLAYDLIAYEARFSQVLSLPPRCQHRRSEPGGGLMQLGDILRRAIGARHPPSSPRGPSDQDTHLVVSLRPRHPQSSPRAAGRPMLLSAARNIFATPTFDKNIVDKRDPVLVLLTTSVLADTIAPHLENSLERPAMPAYARSQIVPPDEVGVYHCIARCVPGRFSAVSIPSPGHDYEHRKEWIRERLELLASVFAIDICVADPARQVFVTARLDRSTASGGESRGDPDPARANSGATGNHRRRLDRDSAAIRSPVQDGRRPTRCAGGPRCTQGQGLAPRQQCRLPSGWLFDKCGLSVPQKVGVCRRAFSAGKVHSNRVGFQPDLLRRVQLGDRAKHTLIASTPLEQGQREKNTAADTTRRSCHSVSAC